MVWMKWGPGGGGGMVMDMKRRKHEEEEGEGEEEDEDEGQQREEPPSPGSTHTWTSPRNPQPHARARNSASFKAPAEMAAHAASCTTAEARCSRMALLDQEEVRAPLQLLHERLGGVQAAGSRRRGRWALVTRVLVRGLLLMRGLLMPVSAEAHAAGAHASWSSLVGGSYFGSSGVGGSSFGSS